MANAELREQLRSLSIPREQRPGTRVRGGGRWGTALLLLLVLGLGGYIAAERFGVQLPTMPTSAPAPVRTALAAAEPPDAAGSPVLTATGKIVSDHRVQVSTKVSGQIIALYFEQGDTVARGQVLAALEDDIPRARRDEAVANLSQAEAQQEYQRVNFARVQRLYEGKQASDIEYADARRAHDEAVARVAAATAMQAFAEKVLHDCQVVAPIAGVVLERNVEVGDFVAAEGGRGAMANSQFASIADMTQLRVEVDVSELDITRLRTGMPCIIVPDAYKDRRYDGHVLWLDPGANYAKATVQVKVRIDHPDSYLRVEGAAQVQFLPAPASAATAPTGGVWIPSAAVRAVGADSEVFVVNEGRWEVRRVSLGVQRGERVQVLSGLAAGAEVAVEGLDRLRGGERVAR
jgi:HlyD family secretion protein